ncbi:energy coupling factor transporter S component ThiW [Aneurinibacillus sp. BA2021]|nr:energy coupling factor transporter S component ThiW [Aneurinibacillus sp. BA2021]
MRTNSTLRLTMMALWVAIGIVGSSFLWFPAGVAKAYPVQHAVNVIAAVTLGPGPAVMIAFMIALIRNLLGIGTVLAFPGSMIGALLAGLLYKWMRTPSAAAVGEVIGTGILGALVSVPLASVFLGKHAGAFAFIPPFFISSLAGAVLSLLLLPVLRKALRQENGISASMPNSGGRNTKY